MYANTGLLMIICVWSVASGMEGGEGSPSEESSQVEVKAFFITNDHNKLEGEGDMEPRRFQRGQLDRGLLPDCDQKLALTIKLPSGAGKSDGEEYIPVEQVVSAGARARLLNPYVLRLRRDQPQQAYPLTLRGTVTVMKSEDDSLQRNRRDVVLSEGDQWAKGLAYIQRLLNTESISSFKKGLTNSSVEPTDLYKKSFYNFSMPKISMKNANFSVDDLQKKVNVPVPKKPVASCRGNSFDSWKRKKRHEHNIIIENSVDEDKMPIWRAKDQADSYMAATETENLIQKAKDAVKPNDQYADERSARNSLKAQSKYNRMLKNDNSMANINNKQFTLYEIGDPEFWHNVNVQLFEKESDSSGKTVWNDLTMGNIASVGPQSPQYEGPGLAARYRSLDWLDRAQFSLPNQPLCLLVAEGDPFDERADSEDETSYMIVPEEDISGADHIFRKRYSNYSDINNGDNAQQSSRVVVRTSRAWAGAPEDSLSVVTREGGTYLALPLRGPRAQIDLEARADHNTLVRVGASGRINTVTSDATRPARASVTVHATNTGLAAASFSVVLKDCGPELSLGLQRATRSAAQLVPPRHTRRYSLPLPAALPAHTTRCSVSLVNDRGEAVATRDAAVKQGDRCFCVWHCDCVCLSEDPKLLCQPLPPALLAAAGVPAPARPRPRPRRASGLLTSLMRSCSSGVGPDFFCSTLIRIIAFAWLAIFSLLVAGFVKGLIGVFSLRVAYFWLEYVARLPPKPLRAYQEPWLKECKVKIDKQGWAVHPRTGQRTVHSMTLMRMILLNSTLFVTLAAMTLNNWIRYLISSEAKKETVVLPTYGAKYHTMDVQTAEGGRRRRRGRFAPRWMSPHAETLSSELWTTAFPSEATLMKPLLLENYRRAEACQSSLDSEQDEQYVLTQMQKSRESLAKSHRKHSAMSGGHSSSTHR